YITDSAAHRADARALRVDAWLPRDHGDLGAMAGLARDRGDFDGAGGNLGHFQREELAHQVRVSSRQRHRRSAESLPDMQDIALQPLTMDVPLARDLLGWRQDRLDPAQIHQDGLGVLALLDDASDDVAFLAGELAERELILGITQSLQDHLARRGGGDPAETSGRVVIFPHAHAVLVGLGCPDRDVPGVPVQLYPGGRRRALGLALGDQEGILDALDHQVHRYVLLSLEAAQDRYVNVHRVPPRPVLARRNDPPEPPADRRRRIPLGHRHLPPLRYHRYPRGGRTLSAPGLVLVRRSSRRAARRRSPA